MDVGPDGRVHVIYRDLTTTYDNGGHPLAYAVGTAESGFSTERVTDFQEVAELEVGSDGSVHVTVGTASSLHYFQRTSSGWAGEKITGNGIVHDLALDAEDEPHIGRGRYTGSGWTLWYATLEDGSWSQDPDVLTDCDQAVSIATDAQDEPHVACHLIDEGLVHVWRTPDGGWSHEVIDDGSGPPVQRDPDKVGWDTSITMDGEDEPHIAYRYRPILGASQVFPGKAHYASKVDGDWVVETVDHDGEFNGKATDIVLDAVDRPHVSYVRVDRFVDGFPGSGQLDRAFDLRYARPLQGEAPAPPGVS
jgi:hypothetical protein